MQARTPAAAQLTARTIVPGRELARAIADSAGRLAGFAAGEQRRAAVAASAGPIFSET